MPEHLLTWVQPTLSGLLALAVLLVLFGFLIPHRQVRRELQREKERGDEYKAAWQAADSRADTLAATLSELVPLVRDIHNRQIS